MTAEQLGLFIAGLVAEFLTWFINKRLGWKDWKAFWAFYIVALVIAVIALFLTTELSLTLIREDPVASMASILTASCTAAGLGNLIYKVFVNPPGT